MDNKYLLQSGIWKGIWSDVLIEWTELIVEWADVLREWNNGLLGSRHGLIEWTNVFIHCKSNILYDSHCYQPNRPYRDHNSIARELNSHVSHVDTALTPLRNAANADVEGFPADLRALDSMHGKYLSDLRLLRFDVC